MKAKTLEAKKDMSFLSRLSRREPERESDRVVRNLNGVLNSRKGFGSVVEGFGLGDYEETWNTASLLESIGGELADAVRRYEPGIEAPAVELDGRDHKLWIRFVLTGRVAGAPQVFYIDIDSKYRNVVVSRPRSGPGRRER